MATFRSSSVSQRELNKHLLNREDYRSFRRVASIDKLLLATITYGLCFVSICIDKLSVYGWYSVAAAAAATLSALVGKFAGGHKTETNSSITSGLPQQHEGSAIVEEHIRHLNVTSEIMASLRKIKVRYFRVSSVILLVAICFALIHRVTGQ